MSVGGATLALAIVEPLAALAIMLLLGPAEPLLAAAGLMPISIGQITFALFAGAWLLRGLARRQILWPQLPITIPLCLYLCAAALSVYFDQHASPKDSATELLKWIEMYLIAGMAADSSGRRRLGWAVGILLGVGAAQAMIGFWQFQFRGHGPEAFKILGDHYRAYGTLEQPNPFGGFMGIVWPLGAMVALEAGSHMVRRFRGTLINADETRMNADLSGGKTNQNNPRSSALDPRHPRITFTLASLATAATLAALFLSFSRGAWLGAAAAGGAMLIVWPRKRWIGVALAGGAVIAFAALYNFGLLPSAISSRFADVSDFAQVYDVRGAHVNDANFSIVERLAHWQAAANMANAKPLFGVGFGNYEAAYPQYRLAKWQYALGHAHMIYLNALAETGAVGLAAYLILWGSIIILTLRIIHRADGFHRALAIALLGCWAHLSVHQFLDNLYVGNIPLFIGALFGLLCILATPTQTQTSNFNANPPTTSRLHAQRN